MEETPDRFNYKLHTITVGFIILYLYVVGDIDLSQAGWGWHIAADPFDKLWLQRAPFYFEAIAMFELAYVVILVSPVNILIAIILALLTVANIDGAMNLRNKAQCSLTAYSGSAGAIPALLAGGACCTPALLLMLGIPALGAFIGLFAWLLPISFFLLVGNRLILRMKGARAILYIL